MAKELFFVDSIYTPTEGEFSVVCLQPSENTNSFLIRSFEQEQLRMYNHKGMIKEGWYVYFDTKSQGLFGYGNLSPFARDRFREYYRLRDELTERYIDAESEMAMVPRCFADPNTNVVSYHVNVGHGNCSIVLIESGGCSQIWMVDCSLFDRTDHWHNYQSNLNEAFRAISKRLGKRENEQIHIDRFFLTHVHHDHYNGIDYLVNHHYIDDRTICYINLFYQMASPTYINTLMELKNANVKFVEPVSANSSRFIRFLHPECRIYRSNPSAKNAAKDNHIVDRPNNSSAVIRFALGNKVMVFPGDLEREGFKHMSKKTICRLFLTKTNYYVVSHHGSRNGHPTMPCMNPSRPWPTPLDCVSHNHLSKSILMGRDGAYPGIYSPEVTSYWNGIAGGLVCTEEALHYVELDWESGKVTYC